MEDSDGVSSTQTAAGSDTAEGTQNTTVLVQMEEEKRAIRAMPFVTTSTDDVIRHPDGWVLYEIRTDGIGD